MAYARDYETEDGYDIGDARYWARNTARVATERASDRQYAQSAEGRLAAAKVDLRALSHDTLDSGADHAAKIAALADTIAALEAEVAEQLRAECEASDDAEAAEWTREVTMARRQAWNEMVRSGKLNDKRLGRPTAQTIWDQQRRQGWSIEALRRAIARHDL